MWVVGNYRLGTGGVIGGTVVRGNGVEGGKRREQQWWKKRGQWGGKISRFRAGA